MPGRGLLWEGASKGGLENSQEDLHVQGWIVWEGACVLWRDCQGQLYAACLQLVALIMNNKSGNDVLCDGASI